MSCARLFSPHLCSSIVESSQVLSKIDHHMHKQNMRVKDLFSKSGFDKSGDGMLDVDEFCMALKLLGVKFSKKETRVLVQFLDESGDGEIEAYELESALRRLRKDVAVLKESNAKLAERNRLMAADVNDLKQGTEAVEEIARKDLGMVRKGETFFLILEQPRGTE